MEIIDRIYEIYNNNVSMISSWLRAMSVLGQSPLTIDSVEYLGYEQKR